MGYKRRDERCCVAVRMNRTEDEGKGEAEAEGRRVQCPVERQSENGARSLKAKTELRSVIIQPLTYEHTIYWFAT